VHEAADDADWRQPRNRLTTVQFLHREMRRGKKISPIFSVFGVFAYLFKQDWLHCADKGVAADFLGNLFRRLVAKMPGTLLADRCNALSDHMEEYYKEFKIEDRLKHFSENSYAGSGNLPDSLKGSAAAIRALVPFGDRMAQQFLSDADPMESAMKVAAHHLRNCYQALASTSSPFAHAALNKSAKIFALQFHALFVAAGDGVSWRVMPKMHIFLELCSEGTEPQFFWCYRDEDFGGSMSHSSKMTGMWKQLASYTRHGLQMFFMKHGVPRFVEHSPD
jgi:hypothetical protein